MFLQIMPGEFPFQNSPGPTSKKVCHKFYTIKRAFQGGNASPAEAHAAIVKQVCDYTLSANCREAGWPTRHGVQAWRGAARGPDAR